MISKKKNHKQLTNTIKDKYKYNRAHSVILKFLY